MTTTTNRPTLVTGRAAQRESDRTFDAIRRGVDSLSVRRQTVTTDGTGSWVNAFLSVPYPANTTISAIGDVSGKSTVTPSKWLVGSYRAAFSVDAAGVITIHDLTTIYQSVSGGFAASAKLDIVGTNQLALMVADDALTIWKFTTMVQLFEVT